MFTEITAPTHGRDTADESGNRFHWTMPVNGLRQAFPGWRLAATLATAVAMTSGCADGPTSIPAAPADAASIGTLASAQPPHYTIIDLGTFGGPFSIAFDVNDAARVVGAATLPSGNQHAFIWDRGTMTDLGTLGGPNSQASGRDLQPELAIVSETPDTDPLGEDFCGLHTGFVCRAAVWRSGRMTVLPTLGGINATALEINNRGEIVGAAGDGTPDATCAPPQRTHFQAVVWASESGNISKLAPLPGDQVGFALRNNDHGQVVGSSGLCSNTKLGALPVGPHAVLWDNGSPINLGNLGDPNVGVGVDVNNRGQVIGAASVPDGTLHPFMWTKTSGIRDLGLMSADPADAMNTPFALNDRGQMVGSSCDATLSTCRGYLWQNGVMTDINGLLPAGSPLYVLNPFSINNSGDIVGLAVVMSTGEVHAFLAKPAPGHSDEHATQNERGNHRITLPESARKVLRSRGWMHHG
jgi:probable HAF family extracellular repeat protein